MEHFTSPFAASDFARAQALENRQFLTALLRQSQAHRYYSHPFLEICNQQTPPREWVVFILTSFYKIVAPYTALLFTLGGRAPTLQSRFALLDNIYEEMGCGDIAAAHPSLYVDMLASIGVACAAAERAPTLLPIHQINTHLSDCIERRHFAVACAVLASAEATIPPCFPVLAQLAQRAFPSVDLRFFERHGARDEGHSDDAAALFALTCQSSLFESVATAVYRDLDCRANLFDEWSQALASR
ncbi:MAG: iron-containing redox enzyme family protein [Pseudomonadales bacterium]|jgi:pyrroloquinoline quinone (PQQ) biosynthesis protein C|nr:iron-containing redox enzyme family protein [Pseudomonadales bacterium]